jgi:hypothetical protein
MGLYVENVAVPYIHGDGAKRASKVRILASVFYVSHGGLRDRRQVDIVRILRYASRIERNIVRHVTEPQRPLNTRALLHGLIANGPAASPRL